jgi:Retroviral aspartyl protease
MGREISAHALLDSSAEGIIVDHEFAKRNKLTLHTLTKPIPVKNVDGTMNQQGAVHYTTIQTIRIKSPGNEYHEKQSELYVTALGDHDVIFGTDWLQAHNPEVDWAKLQLAFTCCPKSCKLSQTPLVLEPKSKESRTTVISRIEPLEEYHTVEVETTDPELFARIHQWDKENYIHVRSKLTTSTELAARTVPRPSMSAIPEKYRSFTKVFSEEASHRLPAHCPWDHSIDLIPGKTMKNSGIYRLTPSESAALKEYITEHLQK